MPGGYLSAFPESLFDRFEAVQPVWAPYYTLHKVLVGLLDQFEIAGSGLAYDLASRLAAYVGNRLEAVLRRRAARSASLVSTIVHSRAYCGASMWCPHASQVCRVCTTQCAPRTVHMGERLEATTHRHGLQHHWRTLDMEYGGMNDVLWRLAALSGRADHRRWASLFDKPCFLAPLGLRRDSLTRMHGNTHVHCGMAKHAVLVVPQLTTLASRGGLSWLLAALRARNELPTSFRVAQGSVAGGGAAFKCGLAEVQPGTPHTVSSRSFEHAGAGAA